MPNLYYDKISSFDWFKFCIIFFVWFLGGWGVVNAVNKFKKQSVMLRNDSLYIKEKPKETVKIFYKNEEWIDRLEKMGVDVIIKQEIYIIARVLATKIPDLRINGFQLEILSNDNLPNKIVKIFIGDNRDIKKLEKIGIEIEKVEENYVEVKEISIKDIIKLKNNKFSVEIIPL